MQEHFQAVTVWELPEVGGQEAGWYSSLQGFEKTQSYTWFVSIVKVSSSPVTSLCFVMLLLEQSYEDF